MKFMMDKIICIVLLFAFPLTGFSDELPIITPLQQGQVAPYSGVLYNPTAVAETIAQREALISQHVLNLQILEERLKAECKLSLDNLQIDLNTCNQKYNQMISIKDNQIKSLQEIALESNNSNWWFAGGILTGVLITIGAVYAAK